MEHKTEVRKWISKSEYYDMENGEEISKRVAKRDYHVMKKIKRIKIENEYGTITWQNECQRKRQLRIW